MAISYLRPMGAPGRHYPLALSEAEVARYQLMAERARVAEADLW
jgi:hypothetical protein